MTISPSHTWCELDLSNPNTKGAFGLEQKKENKKRIVIYTTLLKYSSIIEDENHKMNNYAHSNVRKGIA